ncbi:MAG: hypothetical protein DMG31_07800 [Acidobacteria bacterium]|nr:MAG: hypothetical protein DMG31_07800 [Acidobacteriota bacterium]
MGSKFGFNGVATTGGKKKPRLNPLVRPGRDIPRTCPENPRIGAENPRTGAADPRVGAENPRP